MVKKSLETILKVYGQKIEGDTPYAFVDGKGVSVRSFDGLHTLHISGEISDNGGAKRICLAGIKMLASVAGSFNYIAIGTDGVAELGMGLQHEVPMEINIHTHGDYINHLSKMQSFANQIDAEDYEIFIEKKHDYELICDKLQDLGAILTARDFKAFDMLSFLMDELDVTLSVDSENNDFIVQSKYFTYMTRNSRDS